MISPPAITPPPTSLPGTSTNTNFDAGMLAIIGALLLVAFMSLLLSWRQKSR